MTLSLCNSSLGATHKTTKQSSALKANQYTETVEGYPTDLIKLALKNLPSGTKGMFEDPACGTPELTERTDNSFHRQDEACNSSFRRVFPKWAPLMSQNKYCQKENHTCYILNDDNYYQPVEVEHCLPSAEDQPCNYFDNCLNGEKTSRCVQKYSTRTLTVYIGEINQFFTLPFRFPSHCACKIEDPQLSNENLERRVLKYDAPVLADTKITNIQIEKPDLLASVNQDPENVHTSKRPLAIARKPKALPSNPPKSPATKIINASGVVILEE